MVDIKDRVRGPGPNFRLGDLFIDIPPENIDISRYDSHQSIQHLRQKSSLKIPTGRAAFRIDVKFNLLVGENFNDLEKLKKLIAMTRITPFVPLHNSYIVDHLKPTQIGKYLITYNTVGEDNLSLMPSIPVAIHSMGIIAGGDSPEIIEVRMTLLYWNPLPFIGVEKMIWEDSAIAAIKANYQPYVEYINQKGAPFDANETTIRWWNLKTYEELLAQYGLRRRLPYANNVEYNEFSNLRLAINTAAQYWGNLGPAAIQQRFNELLATGNYNWSPSWETVKVLDVEDGDTITVKYGNGNEEKIRFNAVDTPEVGLDDTEIEPGGPGSSKFTKKFIPIGSKVEIAQNLLSTDRGYFGRQIRDIRLPDGTHFNRLQLEQGTAAPNWFNNSESIIEVAIEAAQKIYGTDTITDADVELAKVKYVRGQLEAPGLETPLIDDFLIDFFQINQFAGNKTPIENPLNRYYLGDYLQGGEEFESSTQSFEKESEDLTIRSNEKLLNDKGWYRVDPDQLGVINPVFKYAEPNTINLTPNAPLNRNNNNQVVSNLAITFQNRFAFLPIQSSQYPMLQHLGSIDSNIMLGISLLANSEQYAQLKQLTEMVDSINQRAIDLRAHVFSGKEIFNITQIQVINKIINSCGIDNAILTSIQTSRHPESPELVAIQMQLTENSIVEEEFKAVRTKGDNALREALLDWLAKDNKSNNSTHLSIGQLIDGLKVLYHANDDAFEKNKIFIDKVKRSGAVPEAIEQQRERDSWMPAHFLSANATEAQALAALSTGDQSRFIAPERPLIGDKAQGYGYRLKTPPIYPPGITLLHNRALERIAAQGRVKFNEIVLPADLGNLSIDNGGLLNLTRRILSGAIDQEVEKVYSNNRAINNYYLSSYGKRLKFALTKYQEEWENAIESDTELDYNSPAVATLNQLQNEVLKAWNGAHHEWYRLYVVGGMLMTLYYKYPDYFQEFRKQYAGEMNFDKQRGAYPDLFLGSDQYLDTDPYDWLDNSILADLRKGSENLYKKSLFYLDSVVKIDKSGLPNSYKEYVLSQDEYTRSPIYSPLAGFDDEKTASETREKRLQLEHQAAARGGELAIAQSYINASNELKNVRYFNVEQLTFRKAFPTFKFYFVEEDNKGIVAQLNDFYSYNGVVDWKLHEAQHRPATLVINLTNLFNKLDHFTINDQAFISKSVRNVSRNAGIAPPEQLEIDGANIERQGDEIREIQGIQLKPGTTVVLKAGYHNNPNYLTTIFAGQVTEVMAGDIMQLVCQDWTSELLTMYRPLDESGSSRIAKAANKSDTQGNYGTRLCLQEILRQPDCRHLGSWKIGANNPLVMGGYNWELKPFETEEVGGHDRSVANIHIELLNYNSVFNYRPTVLEWPTEGHTKWDVIQMLRLRHQDHVAFTRPYSEGEGTFVFMPLWQTYQTQSTAIEWDPKLNQAYNDKMWDAFQRLWENETPILIQSWDEIESRSHRTSTMGEFEIVLHDQRAKLMEPEDWDIFNLGNSGVAKVPLNRIFSVPGLIRKMTKEFIGGNKGEQYFAKWQRVLRARTSGAAGTMTDLSSSEIRLMFDIFKETQYNIYRSPADKWFKTDHAYYFMGTIDHIVKALHLEMKTTIRVEASDSIDRLTIEDDQNTLESPRLVTQALAEARDKISVDATIVDELHKAYRPVRKWHIASSNINIVANNITVNNNFYNAVQVGKDMTLQFDPGLKDVRTKFVEDMFNDKSKRALDRFYIGQSILRDEMKRMYSGEIILVGNPDIRPHDIIILMDHARQIYGPVEVLKVVHSMDNENGFISIVTPGLITEGSNCTFAYAYQGFYNTLADDLNRLSNYGAVGKTYSLFKTLKFQDPFDLHFNTRDLAESFRRKAEENTLENRKDFLLESFPGQAMITAGIAGGTAIGTGAALIGFVTPLFPPFALIAGGLALASLGYMYYSWHEAALQDYMKQHPISITPLSKRGWPWVAGIDSSEGHSVVMQTGFDAVKTLRSVKFTLDALREVDLAFEDAHIFDRRTAPKNIRDLEKFLGNN